MKNNINFNLYEVKKKIELFEEDPLLDANNANLRGALFVLNNIHFHKNEMTPDEFKNFRIESLKLHVKIIELFEKFYIENYKPNKPYHLNIMPPQNSVDGPIFGTVDPAEIKDEMVREKYKSDIDENNRIGKEIAFQGELIALKNALETPDPKVGSVATMEIFIKNNYTLNHNDKIEIKEVIGKSLLDHSMKDKILYDIFEK